MNPLMDDIGQYGKTLRRLSKVFAAVGAAALIGITLMTLVSVIGRAFFSKPVTGDIELVQLTCAVCVAAFMPYTQWEGGNIIVDFFTASTSPRTQSRLDALGAILVGLVTALVGWRTAAGSAMVRDNMESSMLIGIPVWIPYALMTPSFILTALVSFYIAWRHLTKGPR
jgi:TRAP-type C4-dicarboxylate transport system permease small subunit